MPRGRGGKPRRSAPGTQDDRTAPRAGVNLECSPVTREYEDRPARAGMNLGIGVGVPRSTRPPRTRGDVPLLYMKNDVSTVGTPRSRG